MRVNKAFVAALAVCLYATGSPPFVFSMFMPFAVRVVLALGALFCVGAFLVGRNANLPHLPVTLWLLLVSAMGLCSRNEITSLVYSAVNIVFLFLVVEIAKNSHAFNGYLRRFWLWTWSIASVSVIVVFLDFQVHWLPFSEVNLAEFLNNDEAYRYYNNIIFGNYVMYHFFDFTVPKSSWYIFEPGLLSFYLGMNFLLADQFCECGRSCRIFKTLNLVAGLLTFSTTFYIFFIVYALYQLGTLRLLGKFRILFVLLFPLEVMALGYNFVANLDLISFTSAADRSVRLDIAQMIMSKNTVLSFLFGNGIGISSVVADRGLSSGLLNIIIERGFLIFIFLMGLLYKYTKANRALFIFILFNLLAIEMVWWPSLYLALALCYASCKQCRPASETCVFMEHSLPVGSS